MKINQLHEQLQVHSGYLWFLTLAYSMIIMTANWFDARLISIGGLITDAGTLIFPLTFLLSDLITEVYGYKYARRAIWCGFLFNIIFILYGQIITMMPSPIFPTHNDMFDTLVSINARIIIASFCSYFCSEPLNAYMLAKLKIKLEGKMMGLRFVASTVVASGLDSVIFGVLAFYGTMSSYNLLVMILTIWLVKVVIEILGLPLSVHLANRLKEIDHIDIYDKNTDFSIFRLDTRYVTEDNARQ